MMTLEIGNTVCFGKDTWFRALSLGEVGFLVSLDDQEKGCMLLRSITQLDLQAVREVIARMREIVYACESDPVEFYSFDIDEQADKLSRAIGDTP